MDTITTYIEKHLNLCIQRQDRRHRFGIWFGDHWRSSPTRTSDLDSKVLVQTHEQISVSGRKKGILYTNTKKWDAHTGHGVVWKQNLNISHSHSKNITDVSWKDESWTEWMEYIYTIRKIICDKSTLPWYNTFVWEIIIQFNVTAEVGKEASNASCNKKQGGKIWNVYVCCDMCIR